MSLVSDWGSIMARVTDTFVARSFIAGFNIPPATLRGLARSSVLVIGSNCCLSRGYAA